MSMKRAVVGWAAGVVVVACVGIAASSQPSSKILLATGDTRVMSRASVNGDLIATVRAGTALEELDKDGLSR